MTKAILFLLFFLSGLCGLLYQVVWLRLAFASFGVITPLLSVVISIFMAGLFVGSWGGGRWVESRSKRGKGSSLLLYAAAEAVIGLGGLVVPYLFKAGQSLLLHAGATNSISYLFFSAVIIAVSLAPWTIAMGATFPFMMTFVREHDQANTRSFSSLYLANVIGAMCGTLLSAYVLIELLGFHNTLLVAALLNLTAALIAIALNKSNPARETSGSASAKNNHPQTLSPETGLSGPHTILFLTGFASMAFEVLWTRGFTPVLKTTIYAFAQVLVTYLLATWLGSLTYRASLSRGKILSTSRLVALTAISAFAPIIFNDPRLHPSAEAVLISIFPFCAILGYVTPKLIDECSSGSPGKAGKAYAINILGCIVGPLFACYILLPTVGVKLGIIILGAPFLVLYALSARTQKTRPLELYSVLIGGLAVLTLSFFCQSHEEHFTDVENSQVLVKRDHTATVVLSGEGMQKRLFVNGIGITGLTPVTKIMAHLPLAFHEGKPESAYQICFGMGTTFRSLHSWGINVTAAELVPAVLGSFSFFFDDAATILADPKAHPVVDDGRRYLRRTDEKFDIVTLDPPPPVEAAASSLLHTVEFYGDVRAHLKEHGILQQWFPGEKDHDAFPAITRALMVNFPYIRVYRSMENWGYHFLASMSPIPDLTAEQMIERMPEAARADAQEWAKEVSLKDYLNRTLKNQVELSSLFDQNSKIVVTDDRPYNEYYFLRRGHR